MSMRLSVVALLSLISTSCANTPPKRDRFTQRKEKVPVPSFESKRRDVEYSVLQQKLNEHEWTEIEMVLHVLRAEVKASSGNSRKISKIKDKVEPIYVALPKTDDGLLSKATARYAMHRYFTEYHGWSIKGLQPAGAAWQKVMDVEDDATDVNKYMLPAHLQDAALREMKKTNFDLDGLAVLISTFESLDYHMLLSTLYSIITTLDLPVGGENVEDDVRDILEAYLMIYAFGIDIDAVNRQDIQSTKIHLQQNQPAWQSLSAFIWDIKKQMFAKPDLDFGEVVHVISAFGEKYIKWQEEDCTRAHDYLVGLPSFNFSSTLLQDVDSSTAEGRRELFTEDIDFVKKLGAVFKSDMSPRLVIPNYINSQSMCLATASFHSVCCMNKCDAIYAKLEQGVRAPAAKAEELYGLVASLPGQKPKLQQGSLEILRDIADEEGLIQLHSHSFASWMHQAFPLECPKPHFKRHCINPKTPDEWMDTCEDVDDPLGLFAQLTSELQTVWSLSMGKGLELLDRTPNTYEAQPEAGLDDVLHVPRKEATKAKNSTFPWYFLALIASAGIFIMSTIMSIFKSIKCGAGCVTSILDEAIDGDLKGV